MTCQVDLLQEIGNVRIMRVLTDEKRTELTDAAGRVFLKQGFGAATIGMIAEEGGASKATLYRYFSSKEEIFAAYVVRAGEAHGNRMEKPFRLKGTVEGSLIDLGRSYLSILLAPSIMSLTRLVIGEAERFPQLTEIYVSNGPRKVIEFIEEALLAMKDKGWIELQDAQSCAWHFKSLCELRFYERVLWGFQEEPSNAEIEAHLEKAVYLFLHLLAANPSNPSPSVRQETGAV